nr:immunoglobulin light chain junction region [Macaca mulatta]
CVQAIAFPFTL